MIIIKTPTVLLSLLFWIYFSWNDQYNELNDLKRLDTYDLHQYTTKRSRGDNIITNINNTRKDNNNNNRNYDNNAS